MELNERDIREIKALLNKPKKIVITTHRSPDGDAMGSSLGLYHYLRKLGRDVTVVVPNSYPRFYNWLPGSDTVVVYDQQEAEGARIVGEADIVFCLDYNALHRMERLGKVVAESKALRILIDHHQQPEKIAKYMLSRTTASSTAELVYEFIDMLGDRDMVDAAIATNLYVGIMTDTGSFRFASTSAKTHLITADLIDKGVDVANAYGQIFDTNSEDRLRLLGYSLSEKLRVFPEYRTAYIALSREDMSRFNFEKGDDEGLVNYGLSVAGVRFAALIIEMEDLVKLSLRSKGGFSVNTIARKHFHGGGHINAAGGYKHASLAKVTQQFEALLPRYKDELLKD